jgi:chemotaxis protein MotB
MNRGDTPSTRAINVDAGRQRNRGGGSDPEAQELEKRRERLRLIDLKGKIEALIGANTQLRILRNQILIDIISEGLRIQIVDEKNRPMFDLSSDTLHPYTRELLHAIGLTLNGVENRISLSGHTDSAQYAGGERGFSNWELSANRANAARRELITGGLALNKVVRVVGLSDTIHLNNNDPMDPINRRISIIVLNKETEEAIRSELIGRSSEATVESVPEAMQLSRDIDNALSAPPGRASAP